MSVGKFLSLEEARKTKNIDRFAKDHPSAGDEAKFDALFEAMASGKLPTKRQTSTEGSSED